MAIDQDPYRTLGLARGASIDEIKRAYRRLAKIHHPDAAGEKNVPRFLAIQAAYEQLAGGHDAKGAARRPATAPRQPWEADPDRGDATRRAYGGRARGPAAGASKASSAGPAPGTGAKARPGPPPRSDPPRPSRRGSGTTGGPGTSGGPDTTGPAGDASSGTSGAPPRGPRERKKSKATLGSTSYDGVDGPFEPDWRGASWYGTTSGTYWTLNPKEYADPRKHGPEYQARARRATRDRTPGTPGTPDATTTADAGPAAGPAEADPQPPPAATRPTHTTSSWWDSTAGATGPTTEATAAPPPRAANPATPAAPPPDLGRALNDLGRALTDPGFGGQRGRVMRALIGWLPIAFGVSWFVGEMTGCGRFAATCNGLADPLILVIQVIALAVLLLFPTIASVAAMGSIVLLSAAVLAALVLSATGEAADGDSRRSALGAVLLVAWLVGIAIAVARRIRALPSTARPVS